MKTTVIHWISKHKKNLLSLSILGVALSAASIPVISALRPTILNETRAGGPFVAGVPVERSKFVELGVRMTNAPADVSKTAIGFNALIGTPIVTEDGNTPAKSDYSVSIKIACASGETNSSKIGEGSREVIIGTLAKPKGQTEYTFTYDNQNNIPSFVATYASKDLDATDTNLWSYVRIVNIQMDYYTEEGAKLSVMKENYTAVQPKLTDLTNTVIGGTFCGTDEVGGYKMETKIPERLVFGVFYPKTLSFQGLNTDLLWGIEVFGFKCPKKIIVNAYRSNGITNVMVQDNIIYERSENPILLIIYKYQKSNETDEVISDVMGSLEKDTTYKYQLKFDYETPADPVRFSAVKDVTKNAKDDRFYIFFSKAQFGKNTEIGR